MYGQTPGPWNLSSGIAQTTTSAAVGLSTTTPNARFNLVNPSFYNSETYSYFSYDPFHIQFPDLSTMLILKNTGMFGLKTSTPNSYFHLNVTSYNHNMFEMTKVHSAGTSRVYFDSRMTSSAHLSLNPIIQSKDAGIIFSDNNLSNNSSSGFVIAPNSNIKSGIRISSFGDLEISNGSLVMNDGVNNQFKVSSNGMMIARQVDVHLDPIPDFVFHSAFDKDSAAYYDSIGIYKSLTLEEVDTFIQTNRHLPGIKSAAEYQKTGSINIGELQLKMLEKVEELTLYNIQLMKQIEELKKKQLELEQILIIQQPKN